MSTLDVVAQAGGEPANFLDAGGGSKAEAIVERGRGHPLRREGHGRAVQHLRRHHALRRGRARADRGVRPDRADGAVRGAPRRHQRRGGPQAARRGGPAERARREDDARRRRRRSWSWPADGILVDKDTKLVRLRAHRPRGQLPRPATTATTAPTSSPASRPARAARTSRACRSSTRSTRRSPRPARTRR